MYGNPSPLRSLAELFPRGMFITMWFGGRTAQSSLPSGNVLHFAGRRFPHSVFPPSILFLPRIRIIRPVRYGGCLILSCFLPPGRILSGIESVSISPFSGNAFLGKEAWLCRDSSFRRVPDGGTGGGATATKKEKQVRHNVTLYSISASVSASDRVLRISWQEICFIKISDVIRIIKKS